MNFITRYHPLNEALKQFDHFFDLSFPRRGFSNAPAADFYEDADNFYVKAELPGVKKDDVKLEYDRDVLSLSANHLVKQGESEHTFSYQRSVRVPEGVDREQISASFQDGILTVTLPKAEQAKPRTISVN